MSSVSGVCQNRQLLVNVAVSGDGKHHRRFVAAIDTGAMITAIRADLVESMDFPRITTQKIDTASGTVDAGVYQGFIGLLTGDTPSPMRGVEIIALPFRIGDFDLLLGMDILEQCCFVCRGGAFFLGFDGADDATKKAAIAFLGG